MTEQQINLEVAYALPDRQALLEVVVEHGATVEQAIWNRTCKLTDVPKNGDRIEIYRPLIADPKEARRRRAEKAKDEGRADKVTGGRVANKAKKSDQ
jgi:putative ubiquitin-RnfH superfamily antitoxin RatB of RatAB toxin-antitoxin module